MGEHWLWWIAAAVLVGAELVTATFYLLAIGIAATTGGVAAWLGATTPTQFLIAGGVGVALTAAAHWWRTRQPKSATQDSLDIGQTVHVQSWRSDGTARVAYRGTEWDAELASPQTHRAGTLYIVDTRGSRLILSDSPPRAQ